jgi:hypothetical protein
MKLPLECVECGEATGPLHEVDADHPGWICLRCYDRICKANGDKCPCCGIDTRRLACFCVPSRRKQEVPE